MLGKECSVTKNISPILPVLNLLWYTAKILKVR
jgi:hypothetical protein